MMKRIALLLTLAAAWLGAHALSVDTLMVHSDAMRRDIRTLVVLPDDYDSTRQYPVTYLLHGYGDDGGVWLRIRPDLGELATAHSMIIACPDGRNSWYFDSPVDSTMRYETYVSRELTACIDSLYSTVASPAGRAVSGLSMGGHGALYNAMRHGDMFGACGSMSGGVDFTPFPRSWEIWKALGPYASNRERWERNTVMAQLELIKPGLRIIVDCGDNDVFTKVNRNLHSALERLDIPHSFSIRPGTHNAAYWHDSLPLHLQFFSDFFTEGQQGDLNL